MCDTVSYRINGLRLSRLPLEFVIGLMLARNIKARLPLRDVFICYVIVTETNNKNLYVPSSSMKSQRIVKNLLVESLQEAMIKYSFCVYKMFFIHTPVTRVHFG